MILLSQASVSWEISKAKEIADTLNLLEEDGWDYRVEPLGESAVRAKVAIFDEEGEFVAHYSIA